MNFGFIIDNRKCIGCHACTVACKSEHDVPIGVNRTWVKYIEKGEFPNTRRLFSVMRCNHCADAPCVDICPTTALFTRSDGIVDFDNRRCIACKSCMQACPYDALFIDPASSTAAKCNYCAHRIDIGLEPSCVVVCPEHAIISGDMDNPNSEISQLLAREQVSARKVEKGTQPKLFYIDGDELSLNPALAEPDESYMWSTQSTGVGHFARFAQERIGQNAESGNTAVSPGPESDGHSNGVPRGRRVYDAPQKGTLWDWKVAAYVWTKAISAGAFLVPFIAGLAGIAAGGPGLTSFRLGAALLFLILTFILLVKDLDQPARFAYVLLRPQWRSWLVRGGYALAAYGLLLTMQIAGLSGIAALDWLTAGVAVLTAVYTAFLFAQAKGRDFWQSPSLSLHMLVHAFVAGASLFGIALLFMPSQIAWQQFMSRTLLYGLVANLLILLVELVTPHATEDARRTVKIITKGRYRRLFWLAGILSGNLLPVVLLLTIASPAGLALSAALALAGIYCIEHIWVKAPQDIPLS